MKNPNLNELSKRIDELKKGCKKPFKENGSPELDITVFYPYNKCGNISQTGLFLCSRCKTEIEGIKQTLTSMLGELDQGGYFESFTKYIDIKDKIQKLIDKINNQKGGEQK